MNIIITILVLVGLGLIIRACFYKIPPIEVGILTIFGERKRMATEGLRFWWPPPIGGLGIFSLEIKTLPLNFTFFCKDKLEVKVKGSFQWRPDKDLWRRFTEVPTSTKEKGVADAIESAVGIIGGKKDSLEFIEKREAINLLVNSSLRLKTPPHERGDKYDTPYAEYVPLEERLEFYEKNSRQIHQELEGGIDGEGEGEEENNEKSKIEKRYGIDVIVFALADVDYSAETKKALEKAKQAEAEMEASEILGKKKVEIMNELIGKGLTAQEANVATDVLINRATRRVVSLEGASGTIPLINVGGER